ncbi:MAG: toll/interleukin-1 receptor domain-containing protein [Lachnospiraceae bacterium]|nr:toll/interleukin-1 receptor domain-containing protein [Lachnospiraceae bacterium]
MNIFKCWSCEGELEFESGSSIGVCKYCGSKRPIPRIDDERKASMYDRANHYRRKSEYDKAMGIYESILDEDKTEPEAYWGIVLCRYGVEYVKDAKTGKQIPTINRTQYTSIFADEDYKAALQYADEEQRSIYVEEAETINEIQKKYLDISTKETPFDVFICYKETDSENNRTQDSVLAQDIYDRLTSEGLKVFFSRITLENKIGREYEPYIFAALNSAKVMIVIGTKIEYINAPWVKNEWSRYLPIVNKSNGKRVLIPAYKDMDPYDLPEEFSHLQALDMSKIGYLQDLVRGIKKIIADNETKVAVKETVVMNSNNGNTVNADSLLKRAFLFLEDGNWSNADNYFERVLDIDAENARAYLGKLIVEQHVNRPEALANCAQPLENSSNYKNIIRFGDNDLAAQIKGYNDFIIERNENERLTGIFNRAMSEVEVANKESDLHKKGEIFLSAAGIFRSVPGFRNADSLAEQCEVEAEVCRKDEIYNSAKSMMNSRSYVDAINEFKKIPNWKDADQLAQTCERKKKRRTRVRIILFSSLIVALIILLLVFKVIIPNVKHAIAKSEYEAAKAQYEDARAQMEKGEYFAAIEKLESLQQEGFSESGELLKEIRQSDEWFKIAPVGETVIFGEFEQDGIETNGKEDVEWQILERKDDKILVISKYVLALQQFNDEDYDVIWLSSDIRSWLNSIFVMTTFSKEERDNIVPTETDSVFLLSKGEASMYFDSDEARRSYFTKAASSSDICLWYLRTYGIETYAGEKVNRVDIVVSDGSFERSFLATQYHGIRPALWYKVE